MKHQSGWRALKESPAKSQRRLFTRRLHEIERIFDSGDSGQHSYSAY